MGWELTGKKKKYEAPTVTKVIAGHAPSARPEDTEKPASGPKDRKGTQCWFEAGCHVILSLEGKFRKVSRAFCEMVGREASELVGRPIDDITASRTVNIPQHLGVVVHFGQFQSLWLFVDRGGKGVLVQSSWELLPDLSIGVVCRRLSLGG